MATQVAPYGAWPSPLAAAQLAAANVRFGQIAVCGDAVLWSEGRPREGGRNVVVECDLGGERQDRVPAPYDARTRVHEYGGGAFAVSADGELFFSHDADQRLYRGRRGAVPEAITEPGPHRFADTVVDAARGRLVAVREDHATAGGEAVASLVAIDLSSGRQTVLASGHDFFSSPRLSPDGARLAWLSWDHPRMPWQGSDLWVAGFSADGGLGEARHVGGGERESVFQPEWSPSGELHFASDRSGWWNLYRERGGHIQAICPMAAEFGEPQWVFGLSMYGFEPNGAIVCCYGQGGTSCLARIGGDDVLAPFDTPFTKIHGLRVGAGFAAFLGGSPTQPESVVRLDLRTGQPRLLARSSEIVLADADTSVAEAITFRSDDGREAHAFFYAPANAGWSGPPGTRPPLLVLSHGGPTSAAGNELKPALQYWTSRGFAVVDVNYGGSSGYGRAYREQLDGRWGIVDVDDVVAAARYLVERGDVDGKRVAIRGGSAGGFTTLAALTFRSFFKAGASHFGVSDLAALARDTHKFESHYLESLVGPWPERADVYRERSPLYFPERLDSALILFQGADDKAVPPAQAEAMHAAAKARGLPVAYLLFAGEQHGFRRAETIRRVFEAELYFYGRVFGFTPAGEIEPVEIDNLAPSATPA